MLVRRKSGHASWLVIAVAMSVVLTNGCRNRVPPADGDSNVEPAGEPEHYSATVVCIVEDGTSRETSVSREARSGEKRREEWIEEGQNRALIWRPDLGKGFLLDLDGRAYVELEITAGHLPESRAVASNPHDVSTAQNAGGPDVGDSSVQAIDRDFGDTQPPTRVETRVLAPAVIDGHSCAVYEQRAIFRDGHVETSRRFRAGDLSGLLLRVDARLDKSTNRPQIETQLRLFRDGQQVFMGKVNAFDPGQQKDLTRLVAGGSLLLGNDLQPGDYALQLIVTEKLAREENRLSSQWIDFEIVK